jgi:hypothetical protein
MGNRNHRIKHGRTVASRSVYQVGANEGHATEIARQRALPNAETFIDWTRVPVRRVTTR